MICSTSTHIYCINLVNKYVIDCIFESKSLFNFSFICNISLLINVFRSGNVNGIRIPEHVMTTNTSQRVYGKKIFTQPVELQGNIVTINATINGLRIPEDLVLRSTRQTILGRKIFNNTVRVEKSIVLNGTTNGRDLSEFSKRIVTLSTNQIITGEKTFMNGFEVEGNLDVSGLVDGVNLTELDLDAARINQKEIIRGIMVFNFESSNISFCLQFKSWVQYYTFLYIRNKYIRHMRLKSGKN